MGDARQVALEAMKTIDRLLTIRGLSGVRLDGADADTEASLATATALMETHQMEKLQGQLTELFHTDDWVTMNGTHVLIGEAGTVQFGPSRLRGFKYRQYYENHKVTHGTNRVGKISYNSKTSQISQAVHAMGYDGPPKIVDKKEFDKACKASSFAAQRIYCGSTQAVVDAYQHQFYSGSFYVDCTKGGAQYGQGMYCSSDYNGKITAGMKAEMDHYKQLGKQRKSNYSITESMTLDPSAKIVKFGDIRGEYIRSVTKSLGATNPKIDRALDAVQKAAYTVDNRPGFMISAGMKAPASQRAALGAAYKTLKQEVRKQYGAAGEKAVNDAIERAKAASAAAEFGDKGVNVGVLAAEMGYDAINAEGHGKSGSYTVVLNRTKLVVLGDPLHKDAADTEKIDYDKVVFKYNASGALEGWYEGKSIGVIYTMGDMGDSDTGEKPMNMDAKVTGAGGWRTMPNGTKVFINGAGQITKGPANLVGQNHSVLQNFSSSPYASGGGSGSSGSGSTSSSGGSSGGYTSCSQIPTGQTMVVNGVTYTKMKTGTMSYVDPYGKTRYVKPAAFDARANKAGAFSNQSATPATQAATQTAAPATPPTPPPPPPKTVPATTAAYQTGQTVTINGVTYTKMKTGTMSYVDPHGKTRYVKPAQMDQRLQKAGITVQQPQTQSTLAATPTPAPAPAAPTPTPSGNNQTPPPTQTPSAPASTGGSTPSGGSASTPSASQSTGSAPTAAQTKALNSLNAALQTSRNHFNSQGYAHMASINTAASILKTFPPGSTVDLGNGRMYTRTPGVGFVDQNGKKASYTNVAAAMANPNNGNPQINLANQTGGNAPASTPKPASTPTQTSAPAQTPTPSSKPSSGQSQNVNSQAPQSSAPAQKVQATTASYSVGQTVSINGVTYTKGATGTMSYIDPHGKKRYVKPADFDKRLQKAGIMVNGSGQTAQQSQNASSKPSGSQSGTGNSAGGAGGQANGNAPAKPKHSTVDGKDISKTVSINTSSRRWSAVDQVAYQQGFKSPPQVTKDKAEFDKACKASGVVAYRTWGTARDVGDGKTKDGKDFASQLTNFDPDKFHLNGNGLQVHGGGMYIATNSNPKPGTSPNQSDASKAKQDSWGYGSGKKKQLAMTLHPSAKTIDERPANRMWSSLTSAEQRKFGGDIGAYLCSLGYDAMISKNAGWGCDYTMVYNPSKLLVYDP